MLLIDDQLTPMDEKQIRLIRFRQLWKERYKGNIASLARALNKSANQVRFYLNPEKPGGRVMGEDFAREAERTLNLPNKYLDVMEVDAGIHDVEISQDNYTLIPRLSLLAAAGNGIDVNEHEVEVIDSLAFRKDWLRKKGLNHEKLEIYGAKGESMSPHICDGDAVMVDYSNMDTRDNEVWVIWQPEPLGVRIKRLIYRDNGDLVIRSDNPDKVRYPDEIIPGPSIDGQVKLLGKVVWRGGGNGM